MSDASILAAFWYGSLLSVLGLAEPWTDELDEIAEKYFRVFRARARA